MVNAGQSATSWIFQGVIAVNDCLEHEDQNSSESLWWSVNKIKEQDLETLEKVVGKSAAKKVYEYFNPTLE